MLVGRGVGALTVKTGESLALSGALAVGRTSCGAACPLAGMGPNTSSAPSVTAISKSVTLSRSSVARARGKGCGRFQPASALAGSSAAAVTAASVVESNLPSSEEASSFVTAAPHAGQTATPCIGAPHVGQTFSP